MEVKHLSPSTINSYLRATRELVQYHSKSPSLLKENDIFNFLYHLKKQCGLSRETIRNYLQGIKYMYNSIYKHKDIISLVPYPKKTKRLPVILTGKELQRFFNSAKNLKHRVLLKLVYSGGLRRSEIQNLKINNIESKKFLIRIENSKGNKDRYTLLAKSLLPELRTYYKTYQPKEYLFNGRIEGFPMSEQAIRWIFEQALQRSGINKKVSLHSLRHSFASHLLALDTDLFTIQKLMGHDDIRTTMIYLQVNSRRNKKKIVSPLDFLQ